MSATFTIKRLLNDSLALVHYQTASHNDIALWHRHKLRKSRNNPNRRCAITGAPLAAGDLAWSTAKASELYRSHRIGDAAFQAQIVQRGISAET